MLALRFGWTILLGIVLASCSSPSSSRSEYLRETFGDRPWIVDYFVEAKHGRSHLRVFENGERLLVEETCCPRRLKVPELRPLDSDEVKNYLEMIRLAGRGVNRARKIERAEIRSGHLRVRGAGDVLTLREFDAAAESRSLSELRTNESDAAAFLADELDPHLTWVLPR